jgi:DnaJ domain
VETLYDILGAPQDASDTELRRAYHRAARRLHPDVNLDVDTNDDMRQVNRAWAVLGDPHARRSYDRELHQPASVRAPAPVVYHEEAMVHPLAQLLRPSALILAVLLVIFVVTAYAGPRSNDRSAIRSAVAPTAAVSPTAAAVARGAPADSAAAAPSTAATPTAATAVPDSVAVRGLLGECLKLLPGYDAVVQCDSSSDGMVVAEVHASADCPTATRPYQLAGRAQIVCLGGVLP